VSADDVLRETNELHVARLRAEIDTLKKHRSGDPKTRAVVEAGIFDRQRQLIELGEKL
jgi:hypothetical protein